MNRALALARGTEGAARDGGMKPFLACPNPSGFRSDFTLCSVHFNGGRQWGGAGGGQCWEKEAKMLESRGQSPSAGPGPTQPPPPTRRAGLS